jgi:L-alanine-DL-glutamate epimerase-like enolase superfamily enzyme
MSHLNSPIAEFFPEMVPPTGYTLFWQIFEGESVPVNGSIDLTDRPGLGLSLNETFVAAHRVAQA